MEGFFALVSGHSFLVICAGCAMLGIISGILGSFAVLKKQSLMGDGISHAALPGVAAAYLAAGKSGGALLTGAMLSGMISVALIFAIVNFSRIKFETALALTMSVFFGLGMTLLTYIQKIPDANQAGLNRFIFGQAATILKGDVVFLIVCGAVIIVLTTLFWKELKTFAFDPDFGQSMGFSKQRMGFLLHAMLVTVIVAGIQTVGVILMSAMLTAPAAAARQWTDKLWAMVLIAAVLGAVSAVLGALAAAVFDKLPTGPAIVVTVNFAVFISLLFSPRRGILRKGGRKRDVYKP